eukprot:SAG31_NODE_901_length_11133_cov_9.476799_4_plen_403_part_00
MTSNCLPLVLQNGTDLYIIDCRSRMAALGNQLGRGAGVESVDRGYETCVVEHQDMPNIHAVASSFAGVADLCRSDRAPALPGSGWLGKLESTGWFDQLRALLQAASKIAVAISCKRASCLVHCSDGWDRTAQLVTLAMVLLDPHYRTINGLATLIEREWVAMGHQFAQRAGHAWANASGTPCTPKAGSSATKGQVAPIFMQWLDAVAQVMRQFPTEFEYKEELLAFLAEESYSCLYGANFAYDSEQQRVQGLAAALPSTDSSDSVGCVWNEVERQRPRFTSPFFRRPDGVGDKTERFGQSKGPLKPRVTADAISLWDAMYVGRQSAQLNLLGSAGRRHCDGITPKRSPLCALEDWAESVLDENARLRALLATVVPATHSQDDCEWPQVACVGLYVYVHSAGY